jgi:4-hydroxybenzoate polyprenyltransferase
MMSDNTKTHTDIKQNGWQVTIFPKNIQPLAILMRLDRPIGWWLLLLPGWWSIVLANGGIQNMDTQSWILMLLFWIGAIIMRGAGCVMNDIWDRDLDNKVERTKDRPIASGQVSLKQALAFLAILLGFGALILFQMNAFTILLGFCAIPLIIAYPLMKRITYWPQAFLGITFNFGALMGWAAVMGEIAAPAILLYIGGFFWTLGYDTIYAHQDKEDDLSVGIKSSALVLGNRSKTWIFGFFLLAFTFMAIAILSVKGTLVTFILLLLPMAHMAWQLQSWRADNHDSSLAIFKSNRFYGLLLLMTIMV